MGFHRCFILLSFLFVCFQVPLCLKMGRLVATENQSLLSVQALPALHGLATAVAPRRPITGERDPAAAGRTQLRVYVLKLMNRPSKMILKMYKCCSNLTCWFLCKIRIQSSSLIISHCVFYCRVGCY